jgi:hypothetical protein
MDDSNFDYSNAMTFNKSSVLPFINDVRQKGGFREGILSSRFTPTSGNMIAVSVYLLCNAP